MNCYTISCKQNTKFKSVINKVCKEYPKYKKGKLIILLGPKKIKEDKTISQNGIKNGDRILMNDISHFNK